MGVLRGVIGAALLLLPPFHALAEDHIGPADSTAASQSGAGDLDCSTIGKLIRANGGIPRDLVEWKKLMERQGAGEVRQAIVPLSRAINRGSLENARKLLAPTEPAAGGGPFGAPEPPPTEAGRLSLANRLFIAKAHPKSDAANLEFISWNDGTESFDFGVVENYQDPSKMKMRVVPTEQCASCHKSRGPIFTISPWSDTTDNLNLWLAMVYRLNEVDPKTYGPVVEAIRAAQKKQKEEQGALEKKGITNLLLPVENYLAESEVIANAKFDGLQLFKPHGPIDGETSDFDHAVVNANWNLFFRRWMKEQPTATRASLMRGFVDGTVSEWLGGGAEAEQRALKAIVGPVTEETITKMTEHTPFRLEDYDPFLQRAPQAEEVVEHTMDEYLAFNERWKSGEDLIPDVARPTNLKAFLPAGASLAGRWDELVSSPLSGMGKLSGLQSGDKQAFVDAFQKASEAAWKAAGSKGKIEDFRKALLKKVLETKALKRVRADGRLPDPESFRHELTSALEEVLPGFSSHLPDVLRKVGDCPGAKAPVEAKKPPVKSEPLCLRCHTGEDSVGGPFEFDPLNKEEWKKRLTDPKTKDETRSFLKVVLRRIGNGSMPPDKPDQDAFQTERKAILEFLRAQ